MIRQMEKLFDEQIRPSLAAHGGNAEIVDIDNDKLYLKLTGGCQGCASSTATLKEGIERLVKRNFPEIQEIVDVTDHASGPTPTTSRRRRGRAGPCPYGGRPPAMLTVAGPFSPWGRRHGLRKRRPPRHSPGPPRPPGSPWGSSGRSIIEKFPEVREFQEMREAARELGIPRAYLFGGPAATFAHYVREDLERERKGLPDTAERFDYRHDSIFRVNQDIDVALDTDDPDLVARFEEKMARFGHFQGDKPAWEARTLRVPIRRQGGAAGGPGLSSTRTATPTPRG